MLSRTCEVFDGLEEDEVYSVARLLGDLVAYHLSCHCEKQLRVNMKINKLRETVKAHQQKQWMLSAVLAGLGGQLGILLGFFRLTGSEHLATDELSFIFRLKGHGYYVSVEGVQVADYPWTNISCQGFQFCSWWGLEQ
uniref:Uncharacterized protein n=1 Tax=Ananas comosus var. bracteatus TaxID=296719 RepID=A0A6V7QLQ7_ANACO|nr:unnamed protein product [Ananas comosus var. bracteatus]